MFKFEHKSANGPSLTMETDSIELWRILEDFEDFLRGCGLQLAGHLDIVEDEENEEK